MATFQIKGNQNKIGGRRRGPRTTEDTVLGIRYTGSSEEDEDEEPIRTEISEKLGEDKDVSVYCAPAGNQNLNSNLNETKRSSVRRISPNDILALLDEQKSFRVELEDLHRTNFNLEHLLSNCAVKVENFNRKLLLVEYELADFNNTGAAEMAWEDDTEKTNQNVHEYISRSLPLKRSSKCLENSNSSPRFDDGRHKLEQYAKIHGVVDVGIEMYSDQADDYETTTDNKETTDFEETPDSDSEKTFSYGTKDEVVQRKDDVIKSLSDITKTPDSKPIRLSTRTEQKPSQDSDRHSHDSSERLTPDSNSHQPSAELEYSLVDADNDIFSHSIHSNDTIEQIDILIPAEEPNLSSMARTSSTVDSSTVDSTTVDSTTLVEAGPALQADTAVGDYSYLELCDTGTSVEEDEEGGLPSSWVDDVLRQFDRESSRERESLSETTLSNGIDFRLETLSSSSVFSVDDDYADTRASTPDKSSFTADKRSLTPDKRSLSTEKRSFTPEKGRSTPQTRGSTPESRRSTPDRRGSTPELIMSTAGSKKLTPESRRSTPSPRSKKLTSESRGSTPGSDKSSPESRRSNKSTPESGRSTSRSNKSAPVSRESTPDIDWFTADIILEETASTLPDEDDEELLLEEEEETEEDTEEEESEDERMKREEEAIEKLLEDLEITEEDVKMTYNAPTIRIETGVEDGAPTLMGHKNDELDGSSPTDPQSTEDTVTELDHSVFGLEDSDEERKRKWRERPFPRRAARSFFARLCACWHH